MNENEQTGIPVSEDAVSNQLTEEKGQPVNVEQATASVAQALTDTKPGDLIDAFKKGYELQRMIIEDVIKVIKTLNAPRSCVLVFANNTSRVVQLVESSHAHGGFNKSPEGVVKSADATVFGSQSKDNSVFTGTEGNVTYMADGMDVTLHWNNPFIGSNSSKVTLAGRNRNKFAAISTTGVGDQQAPMRYDLFEIEMKDFDVLGAILDKWAEAKWGAGPLGFPTSNEMPTFDGIGRYSNFDRGTISYHPETGAHIVEGMIAARWQQLGREEFGYPLTDEMKTPDWRGRYNHFRQVHLPGKPEASIYWTAETGAHEVYGAIRTKWAEMGWEKSYLGYPTVREEDYNGGRIQQFQGGSLFWTPENGVVVIGLPPPAEPLNF
jgi:hypothetical protein